MRNIRAIRKISGKLLAAFFSFGLLWIPGGPALALSGIKVACVGNSITEGANLKKTYPEVLQDQLGEEYNVRNFGPGGRTLLQKGNLPYKKEKIYREALAWNPDVVIVTPGTNDTKPQNRKYMNDFVKDYPELINSFKELPSQPKIFICYPVPVFEEQWGINEDGVKTEIIPAIDEVARKAEVEKIDLYTPFAGKAHLTYDGIHPNEEGGSLPGSGGF